jgi:adhesin/invasin
MVTHRSVGVALVSLLVLPLALILACDKVPLLAPTGSVITLLIPDTSNVSLNSEMTINATVIENGTASGGSGATTTRSGGGTPVQNGTVVTFTTTIGRIEPSEARTSNGAVSVRLITGSTSGTAVVTAYSGGASATKNINVGTAAVKTVTVTTTPQALGAAGGTAQVSATVTDAGGNPVSGVPVTFATDKGSINPSTATTDANGVATATINTTSTAKITATAGTVTSTTPATLTVNARGLASFSANPNATSAGTPVVFTVTPTTGANVSDVRVNFGDGTGTVSLGAISAAQTVVHTYQSAGNYTATATSSDGTGESGSLSTSVVVGSLPVTLTSSPATPTVNSPATLTVGGIGTAQVDRYVWTFDDGTGPFTTTSPQLTHSFATRGIKNVRVDVFGVGGGKIGTAALTLDVQ